MKIKIMYPNDKGRIELTKEELEKLLNESYSEGYSDGCRSCYTISTPSYPYITYCNGGSTADKAFLSADKLTVSCDGSVSTGSVYATSMSEDAALSVADSVSSSDRYVAGKTETIEICNVNGIGVVKTNEV